MKPTLVADEMFPEGAGPFIELDEVSVAHSSDLLRFDFHLFWFCRD